MHNHFTQPPLVMFGHHINNRKHSKVMFYNATLQQNKRQQTDK